VPQALIVQLQGQSDLKAHKELQVLQDHKALKALKATQAHKVLQVHRDQLVLGLVISLQLVT
jgi:hypothetical protein